MTLIFNVFRDDKQYQAHMYFERHLYTLGMPLIDTNSINDTYVKLYLILCSAQIQSACLYG